MTWKTRAACRGMDDRMDVDDFTATRLVASVKSVCAGCPVEAKCLQTAMVEEAGQGRPYRFLVRGGKSPSERYAMEHGAASCVVCDKPGSGCCDACRLAAKRYRHHLTDDLFTAKSLGCLQCGGTLPAGADNDLCHYCQQKVRVNVWRPAHLYREVS